MTVGIKLCLRCIKKSPKHCVGVKGEEKENHVIPAIKMSNYHTCTLYNYYTENSSKTCSEDVWGELGIEPLNLRRTKEKSSLVFEIIEKKVKIVFVKKFLKKNGINIKF